MNDKEVIKIIAELERRVIHLVAISNEDNM
jgi:hypothetical protein